MSFLRLRLKTAAVPNAFTFVDITNATRSTAYISNAITVGNVGDFAVISVVSGGLYSINGGAYTSSPGTVVNGDSVMVRTTSSDAYSTAVSVTLTIGGRSDTYTVTTLDNTGFTPTFHILGF